MRDPSSCVPWVAPPCGITDQHHVFGDGAGTPGIVHGVAGAGAGGPGCREHPAQRKALHAIEATQEPGRPVGAPEPTCLPVHVPEKIEASPTPGAGEHKVVKVAFGSTEHVVGGITLELVDEQAASAGTRGRLRELDPYL